MTPDLLYKIPCKCGRMYNNGMHCSYKEDENLRCPYMPNTQHCWVPDNLAYLEKLEKESQNA
jgi:hypothetical protein